MEAKDFRESKKQVNDVTRESETNYYAIFNAANDAIFVHDSATGAILDVNRKASEMYGYTVEELKRLSIVDLSAGISPFTQEDVKRWIDKTTTEGPQLFEWLAKDKKGDLFWVEVNLKRALIGGQQRVLAIVRDISERKRLEGDRTRLTQRMQLLLESTDEGIYGLDAEGHAIIFNRAASAMTGFKPEEVLGKNLHVLIHYKHPDGTPYPEEECPVIQVLKTGRGSRIDTEVFWRKDGTSFPVEYSSYPILENGGVKGAVVAFTDITERKKLEEERSNAKELSDTINKIDIALSSALNSEEIMQIVINESAKALGVDAASINLREDGYWLLKYFYGLSPAVAGTKFTDEEVEASVIAEKTRKQVVSNDAYNDERVNPEAMKKYSIRSFLITPLIVKNNTIGVLIYSYHKVPTAFTKAQIEFAEKLAAAASVALENARLVESLKQSEETLRRRALDLQTLNNLSGVFSQILDLETMLDAALDSVMDLLKADGAAIFMLDEDNRVLNMVASRGLSEYFIKNSSEIRVGERSPGVIAKTGEPLAIDDLAKYPELEASFVYEVFSSLIGVPIRSKGKTLGVFQFGSRLRGKFTQVDKTLIEAIGNELGVAVENARLYEVERHIADTLQEALLTIPEQVEGIDFGYLYRSATEAAKVGGDFYDLFELEHDRVGIVIGDVSGKGVEAATLTSLVKNTIKAYSYQDTSPASTMQRTNDVVLKASLPSIFVTTFFGILDTKTGTLIYCSGGHPPGILRRKSGEISLLITSSPMIGAFPDLNFIDNETRLEKGDILILYTDGAIEARCNGEFFGEEKLVEFISTRKPMPTKEYPQAIFNAIMMCTHGTLYDDLALLTVSLK